MSCKDEWLESIIKSEEGKDEEAKSYAKLCEEIYLLVFRIINDIYDEEEYINSLSVSDKKKYLKRVECLKLAYKIYSRAEDLEYKIKALCRKIYKELNRSKSE